MEALKRKFFEFAKGKQTGEGEMGALQVLARDILNAMQHKATACDEGLSLEDSEADGGEGDDDDEGSDDTVDFTQAADPPAENKRNGNSSTNGMSLGSERKTKEKKAVLVKPGPLIFTPAPKRKVSASSSSSQPAKKTKTSVKKGAGASGRKSPFFARPKLTTATVKRSRLDSTLDRLIRAVEGKSVAEDEAPEGVEEGHVVALAEAQLRLAQDVASLRSSVAELASMVRGLMRPLSRLRPLHPPPL